MMYTNAPIDKRNIPIRIYRRFIAIRADRFFAVFTEHFTLTVATRWYICCLCNQLLGRICF